MSLKNLLKKIQYIDCTVTIKDTNSETIICNFKPKKKLVTDNLDTIEFLNIHE